MKKWLAKASAADTRTALIIYYLVGLLNAYFVVFLFPPKLVQDVVQKATVSGGPSPENLIKITSAVSSIVGLVASLFVMVYLYFLLYYIVLSLTKTTAVKATNKLVKRGFYISYAISGIVSSLFMIVTTLINQETLVSKPIVIASSVITIVITYSLIYGFIKYLAKQPKQAIWVAGVGAALHVIYVIGAQVL
ncbi:hypothetical protein FC83_GL001258 [Agrilactobacillus composti DSM 18527 = JCM 14202]|uniref:Yip1 domain-containing protein n=1 Tax=Agrilactobacillus composti DSM 18527 = JCM 14202 TaxID=1423734 RepID=X0PF36_9LACO|nr:hypothetical protein [Agrilactobacillus composti]KRM35131.1 hypothetical protein FC83_GL001258 [Agrilactobacillus composti DSM 18527 = JCM 14202]GAF40243.1 hypothetical protein JCM14202_2134 [Agrilactobacillus composti DSM 18527 = JCM 14202]